MMKLMRRGLAGVCFGVVVADRRLRKPTASSVRRRASNVWLVVGGCVAILYGLVLLGFLSMIAYGGFWLSPLLVRVAAVIVVGAFVAAGIAGASLGTCRLIRRSSGSN